MPCITAVYIHVHLRVSGLVDAGIRMSTKPPIYKPEQLEKYLQRINYGDTTNPAHSRLSQLQQHTQNDPLNAVSEVQRRHLCSIPWGNSALHYSQHHSISVHPESIFDKIVVAGRDGYCMETTNLLYGILQSLGLQVYPSAGRVSNQVSMGNNDGSYQQLYVLSLLGWRVWYTDKLQESYGVDHHHQRRKIHGMYTQSTR